MQIAIAPPELDVAVTLTSQGFVRPVSDELISDVAAHLNGDLVLRILEDEIDVGFATFSVHGELLYLNGVQLNPVVHGRSVCGEVVEFARQETGAKYLALRTQNPRMWAVGHKLCSDWFPREVDNKPDSDIESVIELLAKERSLPFPTHVACYGSALYGEKPVHSDGSLQKWWDSICNFEGGDGVVCVGRFR